jgi:hypothetical protein
MKKTTKNGFGIEILSLEESMHNISCRLDELTGNAMGNSYLKLDMEPVELANVESELEKLNEKVEKLTDAVDSIAGELQSISSIAETLDNFLGWYIQFNESKKSK